MVYFFMKKMRNDAKISRRINDAVFEKAIYGSTDPEKG